MNRYYNFKEEDELSFMVKKQKRGKAKFTSKVKSLKNFDNDWDEWNYSTFEKITKGKRRKW